MNLILCLFLVVKNLFLRNGFAFLPRIHVIDDIIFQFMTTSIVSSRPRFIKAGIINATRCVYFRQNWVLYRIQASGGCSCQALSRTRFRWTVVPEPRLAAFGAFFWCSHFTFKICNISRFVTFQDLQHFKICSHLQQTDFKKPTWISFVKVFCWCYLYFVKYVAIIIDMEDRVTKETQYFDWKAWGLYEGLRT